MAFAVTARRWQLVSSYHLSLLTENYHYNSQSLNGQMQVFEEEVGSGMFGSVFGFVRLEPVHYPPKLSCIHKAHGRKFYPTVELTQAYREMMDDIRLQHLTNYEFGIV